jgi:flagellar operon protein
MTNREVNVQNNVNVNTLRVDLGNQTQVTKRNANEVSGHSFQDVLTGKIRFSNHANVRLSSRDIKLTGEQLKRVENGVDSARMKGVRDSLVLVDDIALVVNVKSGTVITAMSKNGVGGNGNESQNTDNVYTNIDGAVIV